MIFGVKIKQRKNIKSFHFSGVKNKSEYKNSYLKKINNLRYNCVIYNFVTIQNVKNIIIVIETQS